MSDDITIISTDDTYQLDNQPEFDGWWEKAGYVNHPLASGLTKQYKKGYKFFCKLTWSGTRICRKDQMDDLIDMYNNSAGMTIQPFPSSRPDASFGVEWNQEKLDMHLVEGVSPFGYHGTMLMEGNEIYSSIPKTWVTGDG